MVCRMCDVITLDGEDIIIECYDCKHEEELVNKIYNVVKCKTATCITIKFDNGEQNWECDNCVFKRYCFRKRYRDFNMSEAFSPYKKIRT